MVESASLQAIRAVQPCGSHLDQDLRRPRRGQLDFAELEHFGPPGLTDSDRFGFEHGPKPNAPQPTVQVQPSC